MRASTVMATIVMLIAFLPTFAICQDEYLVPEQPEASFAARYTSIPLGKECPVDVTLKEGLGWEDAEFAQIRYGSADSTLVTIALVPVDVGWQLFVDANRDRWLDQIDAVAAGENGWQFELPYEQYETSELSSDFYPRQVSLKRMKSGHWIGMATLGYLEQPLQLNDRKALARFVDSDGNGRFGDQSDRVWLDLNDDGNWSPFLEQFSCRPVMEFSDERFSLVGNEAGTQFKLKPLEGAGKVHAEFAFANGAEVLDYYLLLVGEDGSALSINKEDGDVEVPVGRYRVSSMQVSAAGEDRQLQWNYVFSALSEASSWYEVRQGESTTIRPLHEPTLGVSIANESPYFSPGDSVHVRPFLTLASGMFLNSVTRGEPHPWRNSSSDGANIRLMHNDKELDLTGTGFA